MFNNLFFKITVAISLIFYNKKFITTHSIIFIVGHPKLLILQWNKNYSHFLKRKLLLGRNLIIREWVGTAKLHQMGLNIFFMKFFSPLKVYLMRIFLSKFRWHWHCCYFIKNNVLSKKKKDCHSTNVSIVVNFTKLFGGLN